MEAHPFDRYKPIIDDWQAFMDALSRPLPVCVWTNTLRTSPDRLRDWFAREGLDAESLPWYQGAFKLASELPAGRLLPYRTGHCHIQEEVSLLPARLLDPQPGERILDLCAAPGNKTAQIAVAMQNRGTIIANDRSEGRLHVLRRTLARLGVMNVTTTVTDAARYPDGEAFDRVLLDGPCSCEGTSRKHPSVVWQSGPGHACRMGRVQTAMLRRAVRLCKPGGRIVYSTCTYAPEENEAVVHTVLREADGAIRIVPVDLPGLQASPGLECWNGNRYDTSMRHALRIWPHQNDSGGFFVAVLEKIG